MWSTLESAGRGAAEVLGLLEIMTAGALVIWISVTALAVYAMRKHRGSWTEGAGLRLIVVGGVIVPLVVLSALLALGIPALSRRLEAAPEGALRVLVSGEQWWWRVTYQQPGLPPVELANEIRLPRGQKVDVVLSSVDVIHSFWVPSLAGKVDMIPGRVTRLLLEPERNGIYRGVCAEYCGESHAHMGFAVEVMEPEMFERWLAAQAQPAVTTNTAGLSLFESTGCGACHSIRGTAATASIGPDLTHAGSRMTIAAGTLPNSVSDLERFIANPAAIKPGSLMPPFSALSPADLRAIAEFVKGLQ